MAIQAIPGPSVPLETIFLHDFLEKSFSVNDSIFMKNESSDLKRIESDHHFHDLLFCYKRIIVQVASDANLSETLIHQKFIDSA